MTVHVFENCVLFDGVSEEFPDGMNVVVENDVIREISDRPIKLQDAA